MPSRNRPACLERTLAQLLPQARRAAVPVLVCDQSATAIAARPGLQILHRPGLSGLPAARNALLAATEAEWCLFLDDDCDLAPDFLDALRRCIADKPVVVAWGPVVEVRNCWLRRAHRLCQLGALRDPRRLTWAPADLPTRALFGCCFALRRAAALSCGGCDTSRPGYALGEDLDLCLRLRGAKRFAAALRCQHREEQSGRADPLQRGRDKARLLLWLARRHGQGNPATLLHLIVALLGAALGARLGREPCSLAGLMAGLLRPLP